MVLGLEGTGVILAYIGSILAAFLCVIYGIICWNKPKEDETKEIEEEIAWEKHDLELSSAEVQK